eukprot:GDKH01004125.1.p4 GENE.GDKH01004125.1~~GDKH01004125.1.p4  ORF type:complete len:55 (+),score=1.63 GDKH01004125.1:60-224(+)
MTKLHRPVPSRSGGVRIQILACLISRVAKVAVVFWGSLGAAVDERAGAGRGLLG